MIRLQNADNVLHALMSNVPTSPLAFYKNRSGFSEAELWRFTALDQEWVLRAWPPSMGSDQLKWIHQQILTAHRHQLPFIPQLWITSKGQSVYWHENRGWEVTTWLPGAAVPSHSLTTDHLTQAMLRLAELHTAWASEKGQAGPLPSLLHRRQRAMSFDEEWLRTTEARCQGLSASPRIPAACRILRRWRDRFLQAVNSWSQRPLALQVVHGDLWSEHLLFTGHHLTGLVDFGNCRVDHAAVDLARLLGSWIPHQKALWTVAVEAYQSKRRLPPETRDLIDLLDWTGRWSSIAYWLDQLAAPTFHGLDPTILPQRQRAIDRFHLLLDQWTDPA